MGNREVGAVAEKLVASYLTAIKYELLHQNWTCRWGEIDIIAQKNKKLIFVEVKYRSSEKFGNPHQAITKKKLNSLKNSIWRYLYIHDQFQKECRLDVVCVFTRGGKYRLKHYRSVTF